MRGAVSVQGPGAYQRHDAVTCIDQTAQLREIRLSDASLDRAALQARDKVGMHGCDQLLFGSVPDAVDER